MTISLLTAPSILLSLSLSLCACARVVRRRARFPGTKCEVISLHRANRVNFATHRLNAAAGGVVEATAYRSYRFAPIDLTARVSPLHADRNWQAARHPKPPLENPPLRPRVSIGEKLIEITTWLSPPLITFLFARFITFVMIDEYIVNVNFYPKNRVFYSIDQVSSFESRLSYFYSMNEINIDRWNATFTGISLYLTSELYRSLIKF